MTKESIATKEDLLAFFKKLGLKQGSRVLVETSDRSFSSIVGGAQTLIEALKECVGSHGCLIMPAFTFETLDPASDCFNKYPYEYWDVIRQSINGYNPKISSSYTELSNQLLRNPNTIRTKHPVYSFAFMGKVEEAWVKQSLNYPISFHHVLSAFRERNAFVLCIDFPFEESCIVNAFAKEFQRDLSVLERAYLLHHNQNEPKTYLTNRTMNSFAKKVEHYLKKRTLVSDAYEFVSYELETSLDTMEAIFSNPSHSA